MAKAEPPELAVDFVGGAVGYRLRSHAARSHALLKATGVSGAQPLHVIDATAGLGRDSFLMASMGATVTMIERAPGVHALLAAGLARARGDSAELAAIVSRMTLLHGDAKALLPGLTADVVLVDPMHPERKKTALVKQEMRLLRQLVGADPDVADLMQAALACRCKRVVLKWPLRAEPMPGLRKPSYHFAGKTVRYDVFVLASATAEPDDVADASLNP
ncbi:MULTISPECIES: class I SAM-dependent methyltransferase [Rhodopseudomonas]|uniref:Ribosomal RNA small subunit methyltransferase J n=1 Tax=Rhodopseudomonas palustris TaxID=1076 RepID=A0A0D7EP31_RHOPL|nr:MULTISPECIES: class I SAM-dependent methyltransferase [Rhodopseudomonas]KIZ42300.1 16S rRNA methyltransferase [Rhodopseudomonas palustris]MDF3808926.1 class I SAM-dependent methyltransferase [Rhodopseudomonas sp. BAL398]WOK18365.1 class I SAM-dependent methyltransferase [Rhodopseudomonas sp. BAL398]